MSDRESANIMKEKMTVLCVKPGKKPMRIEIEDGLGALQRAVGGCIEAVRLGLSNVRFQFPFFAGVGKVLKPMS